MLRVMLGQGVSGINGFTGRYTFTIDHTQCGSADSTNFPVCVRETRSPLKTIANGGTLTNAFGFDFVFCSDAALTTLLDFEVESWDAATGAIVAHVRIPTVSHTVDTVFYMGYGKASITTDQSNRTGTWNANYGAVYHFGSTTGGFPPWDVPDRVRDATSNANTLGNGANFSTGVTGQIGAGLDVGNTTQVLGASDTASLHPSAAFTIEAWARAIDYSDYRTIVAKATGSVMRRNYALYTDITTGKATLSVSQAGVGTFLIGTGALSTTVFSHIVGTYDGANLRIYVNGAEENSTPLVGAVDTSAVDLLWVGCFDVGFGANFPWQKYIDEVRLSNTARSPSWITSQYNNQKSASTFYTVS
jgi:biopolymer transport protein ExbB